jgi:hypothetical protein
MNERNVRGQREREPASKTRESPSFTSDDRLVETTPGVRARVQSLPRLRSLGPIRCARGLFAGFNRMERAPLPLSDAFFVRIGFVLTETLPSHKVRLLLRSRPAPSDVR